MGIVEMDFERILSHLYFLVASSLSMLWISNCWEKPEIDAIAEKKLKLIQEMNLRFETQINVWVQTQKNDPEIDKLNSWFTLIGPLKLS